MDRGGRSTKAYPYISLFCSQRRINGAGSRKDGEGEVKKQERIAVYEKYDGHCAYCGNEIQYKDMQVDHIRPKREWIEALEEGIDIEDINNKNPSCRRCNHYKRSLNLEKFREYLKTLHERISNDYITKVGLDYGIVQLNPFDGVFYFEKVIGEKIKK